MDSSPMKRTKEISSLKPTEQLIHANEVLKEQLKEYTDENKKLIKKNTNLSTSNAVLEAKHKNARIIVALSGASITIGGGVISSNPVGSSLHGLGWGLVIVGSILLFVNAFKGF